MKKLFGLFLLALAFLAPDVALAASRFWVGGAGTWDSTTTTHWSASTGGAGGASAPVAGDAVTFDGASGGGTVTPDGTISGVAFLSLTAGAFTGTLAFNTSNPNMSFTSFVSFAGSGTRTINMGSGTWTITGNSGTIWDVGNTTGLTPTFSNATVVFAGASATRTFIGGALTYGAFTAAINSSLGNVRFQDSNTFGSMTIGNGNCVITAGMTITNAFTMTGTSSAPVGLISGNPPNPVTVTVGAASTIDWGGVSGITKAGAGSITATNSLDMSRNTGVTITPPSVGGGGGRIIGG